MPRKVAHNAALITDELQNTIMVTQPFSAFYGQVFTVVDKTEIRGKIRLICIDSDGNRRIFPAFWTDYKSGSSRYLVGQSDVDFKLEDLNMLAKMLSNLKKV
jgi:hypothetical protein